MITCEMSVVIVDRFKVVDIDNANTQRRCVLSTALNQPLHIIGKVITILYLRQPIGVEQMFSFSLQLDKFRHVSYEGVNVGFAVLFNGVYLQVNIQLSVIFRQGFKANEVAENIRLACI